MTMTPRECDHRIAVNETRCACGFARWIQASPRPLGPGEVPSPPVRLQRIAARLRDHGLSEYVAMRASALDEMALELERLAWMLERIGLESASGGPPF